MPAPDVTIAIATPSDANELLLLMRAYCDFYEVEPSDEALRALMATLCAEPEQDGLQFIARDGPGHALGFATLYWTFSTLKAARIGVMEDLFVAPRARGTGLAERLIAACAERCRERGAVHLAWQTAADNHRAQRVYDRVGATRSQWVDYSLEL